MNVNFPRADGAATADLVMHTEISRDAVVVTTVIGEVDVATAPQLLQSCRDQSMPIDVVDLRFVPLFSAAGITVLLELHRSHPIRVVASTAVMRVLAAARLVDTFTVTPPSGPPSLHRAPFGVAVHDSDLRFVYVNDALAAINGLAAQDHYGCHPSELFDVDVDGVTPLLRSVLATGIEQVVRVAGATAAASQGVWRCRYWRARYGSWVQEGPAALVVAVIDHLAEITPPADDLVAASLVFERRQVPPHSA